MGQPHLYSAAVGLRREPVARSWASSSLLRATVIEAGPTPNDTAPAQRPTNAASGPVYTSKVGSLVTGKSPNRIPEEQTCVEPPLRPWS
jgi:hypothetical protein